MILSSFWHIFGSAEEAAAFFTALIYTFFVVLQVTLGIYCMVLMKKKGYGTSPVWFILGFFLTFIGLFICIGKKEVHYVQTPYQQFGQFYNPPPTTQAPVGVHCDQCGTENPTGSNYCHECGSFLDRTHV